MRVSIAEPAEKPAADKAQYAFERAPVGWIGFVLHPNNTWEYALQFQSPE